MPDNLLNLQILHKLFRFCNGGTFNLAGRAETQHIARESEDDRGGYDSLVSSRLSRAYAAGDQDRTLPIS